MRALAAALLLLAAPAAAQDAGERAAVAAATERGRLIHAYDRAAWLGTDDMLAKVTEPASKLAGYIADGPADAPRLIFYDKQPTPTAVYIARFGGGRLVEGKQLGAGDDRTLSTDVIRAIRAKEAATRALTLAKVPRCGPQAFNTVVLQPTTSSGPVRVYFLTPQPDNDHLPFGGHYVVDVAADGTAKVPRAFTRSCLTMSPKPPPGAQGTVGLMVSHLLDPVPTEIHVFSSLAARKPVYVATMKPTSRLWTVDGATITGPRPFDPPKR